MICKKIDFYDEELEENVSGYIIVDEEEVIVIFDGYNKQGIESFSNLEDIIQELIHTKEMLSITKELMEQETRTNNELEEILNSLYDK